ncbi:hypothetical protein [Lactiplantibacillus pentosus]|uniref:hypothetical protein n=1 Tax=Lactiplantibacillus pentosus TaxID=1589 RepID=UPI0023490C2F|nr:hypothetical protein [Lactiplantibacillus pentosus]MDC6398622.1 hypothetical protein [Lactiplantibacillus pentosus]
MQSLISDDQQEKLLTVAALNRLNKSNLANEIGVSQPTLRKILISQPPIIVNNRTYFRVNEWLTDQARDND